METNPCNIKVMLVDDHALIIDGIRNILKNNPRIGEVTAFTTGSAAMEAVTQKEFGLYIIDLELPEMNGYDLIEHIFAKRPEVPVIVCTMHEEIWTVNRLVELGVRGIVMKSSATGCLEKAVNEVLDGQEYFCPRFEHLKQTKTYRRKPTKNSLPTKRELDVLKLIAKGATTEEIGDKLNISVNTVETFRKNLMIKLDAKNVAHLMIIAVQKQLLTDPL